MQYKNIKTGAVIDITSKLADKSWELVVAPTDLSVSLEENEAPKKKSVKVDKKKKG